MANKKQSLIDLLSSLSGILIFLSISHLIQLTGFLAKLAPIIIIIGLGLLFWPRKVDELTPNYIKLSLIKLTSHILLFIGLHVYLSRFISGYWWTYLILGFLFLNYNREIADMVFAE